MHFGQDYHRSDVYLLSAYKDTHDIICPCTGDVNFDCLLQCYLLSFSIVKLLFFPFVISKYLVGDVLRTCKHHVFKISPTRYLWEISITPLLIKFSLY